MVSICGCGLAFARLPRASRAVLSPLGSFAFARCLLPISLMWGVVRFPPAITFLRLRRSASPPAVLPSSLVCDLSWLKRRIFLR